MNETKTLDTAAIKICRYKKRKKKKKQHLRAQMQGQNDANIKQTTNIFKVKTSQKKSNF